MNPWQRNAVGRCLPGIVCLIGWVLLAASLAGVVGFGALMLSSGMPQVGLDVWEVSAWSALFVFVIVLTVDTSLGHTPLRNLTQEETHEVFFQNHWVSQGNLRKQLLYER